MIPLSGVLTETFGNDILGIKANALKISIKIHPKSKKIEVLRKDARHYEVWVREVPEKGKANQAVIKALADHLGVPPSRLTISYGHASRNKIIEIK